MGEGPGQESALRTAERQQRMVEPSEEGWGVTRSHAAGKETQREHTRRGDSEDM